jgi:hypothetical protein
MMHRVRVAQGSDEAVVREGQHIAGNASATNGDT